MHASSRGRKEDVQFHKCKKDCFLGCDTIRARRARSSRRVERRTTTTTFRLRETGASGNSWPFPRRTYLPLLLFTVTAFGSYML